MTAEKSTELEKVSDAELENMAALGSKPGYEWLFVPRLAAELLAYRRGGWPEWVVDAAKNYMQVRDDFKTGKTGGIESLALLNLSSALGERVISAALTAAPAGEKESQG